MGSGLILLVIVGAWLAVLVPIALRSHDASSSLGTVDKFHDAMRVLSRRERTVGGPPAPAGAVRSRQVTRTGPSPAARRLRALLVLAVLAVATLAGGLLGPTWLLVPHAVTDLLLVGMLGWLRRQAVRRAEREWRAAMAAPRRARRAEPVPGVRVPTRRPGRLPSHVAGIPARMPTRVELDRDHVAALPVPAARHEDPAPVVPARGAKGEPWQPVPVPVPTYVNAPVAPRRVIDLTRSGESADDLAAAERSLGIDDRGPGLEDILDRRRAVGG